MDLDTKSKKTSYSPIVKFICIILSAVMFFVCGAGVLQFIQTVNFCYDHSYVDDVFELCASGKPDFFDCALPIHNITSSVTHIGDLFEETPEQYRAKLEKNKDAFVNGVVNQFSLEKSEIIRKELVYIAQNYNTDEAGVYNTNGYSQVIDESIPETPLEQQKYPVDPYASKTVQMVQKILNYAEGTEFLKYSSLVRNDAFFEYGDYSYDDSSFIDFYLDNYEYQIEEVKSAACDKFDERVQDLYAYEVEAYNNTRSEVEALVNTLYYVKQGDKVYTNMQNPEAELASIKSNEHYLLKENGVVEQTLIGPSTSAYYHRVYAANTDWGYSLGDCDFAAIYINDDLAKGDRLWDLYSAYHALPEKFNFIAATIIISLFVLIGLCAVIFSSAGHKYGEDGITLLFIDKMPTDLHLILSGGAIFGLGVLWVFSLEAMEFYAYPVPRISGALFAVAFLILLEWLTSVVRIKKAGKSWFKNCIIIKILAFIFKWLGKGIKKLVNLFRKPIYAYKMKYLAVKFLILAILFILFNALMIFFGMLHLYDGWPELGVALFVILVLADVAVMFFVARYMKMLDKIIVAATERKSVNFGGERVPESLDTLNDALKISKEEMNEAVQKAVKNERTKTELITNVSHDLKTPLTSMISYVDLLKKCDIKDEDALKYIDVLSDKSQNLKSLIENLIEASKASSGNIKINKVYINLKELSAQATTEFLSDFEARGLELRFKEDCEDIRVFVDGQQTYRVLENLLSNAKKYSAKGTRVYASIRREGEFGVFEIKNISKEPLNISPDELTERFVRGDASRGTEEGNGLGLSIAKQLCLLQGGELKLTIDGDLFKAAVYLPMK